ncbi:MAG: sodium-translocating pyrophosphatase [Oscillospiraceae bacterium]|nr:sodium-translocating pyrophosphatase [Oscillospiraceae bacterium]
MEFLFWIVPAASVCGLLFALNRGLNVLKAPEGSERMVAISGSIRKGANAYLGRQYKTVGIFFAAMFVILGIMSFLGFLTPFVPFAFLSGGFFSGLSGFIGMKIATAANARTAYASSQNLNRGLRVAFAGGSVMGFTVVGLGMLDLSIWYILLKFVFYTADNAAVLQLVQEGLTVSDAQIQLMSQAMLTFGMGASSMALFARVGGGIFTKAADVGADLVGKVEAGIPEDDPRNPAVIADNVGDNVGDVAGMGADLYESYVGSVIATIALAVSAGYGIAGALVPMIIAAAGILISIVGTVFVRCKENASDKELLGALRKGTWISSALIAAAAFAAVKFLLADNKSVEAGMGVCGAILSGLVAGVAIGFFTEYYTSDVYKPTKKLAGSSKTGSATIIISGISLGMASTAIPVIIVGISVLISFLCAGGSFGADFAANFSKGLYGIGLSAVGMLSTLGITLATDAYGPIADNAGGIAEMSGLPPEVRERTDKLDGLGNTTAATGKGFAIGSAALTALALIVAYIDEIALKLKEAPELLHKILGDGSAAQTVEEIRAALMEQFTLTNPPVLVGLFIGAMLPFLFSSMTMNAVGRAAQSVVVEVRRQFKEIKGLLTGEPGAEADYAACVDICTKGAQKEMIAPAVVGVVSPLVVGLILGVNGVVGMLAGATATGFVLAVMMSNAGGAWDNAKKHIEAGNFGGKHSEEHKASVVGDTVGDPFKDTSGPSINILIKLLSMVSIVFAGLVLSVNLVGGC